MTEVTCVLDAKATLGESPVWSARENALYWVDIPAPALHRLDLASGSLKTWKMPETIGCLGLRAKGGAVVTLREDGGETVLDYNADAQVGGKIAQVGARLITCTARKLADEFFGKFATTINNPSPAAVAGVPSSATAPPATPPMSPRES